MAAARLTVAPWATFPGQQNPATVEVALAKQEQLLSQMVAVAVTADLAVKRFHWECDAANLVAALLALAMTAKLEAEL